MTIHTYALKKGKPPGFHFRVKAEIPEHDGLDRHMVRFVHGCFKTASDDVAKEIDDALEKPGAIAQTLLKVDPSVAERIVQEDLKKRRRTAVPTITADMARSQQTNMADAMSKKIQDALNSEDGKMDEFVVPVDADPKENAQTAETSATDAKPAVGIKLTPKKTT